MIALYIGLFSPRFYNNIFRERISDCPLYRAFLTMMDAYFKTLEEKVIALYIGLFSLSTREDLGYYLCGKMGSDCPLYRAFLTYPDAMDLVLRQEED